ncbi:CLUMA_CG000276, isoform A [Clunio marinus]|uniref:CLUMA_CG000276, isoform A n=1 Tax=Clunio marinus TaxID=568069 RepID=A0A1J1HEM0_9DIPT|nr:CLUMA_CG000276, isoform A [Clunio marinus]
MNQYFRTLSKKAVFVAIALCVNNETKKRLKCVGIVNKFGQTMTINQLCHDGRILEKNMTFPKRYIIYEDSLTLNLGRGNDFQSSQSNDFSLIKCCRQLNKVRSVFNFPRMALCHS